MITMQQLDEIRRKSTAAKEHLRRVERGDFAGYALSDLDFGARSAMESVIRSVARDRVRETEAAADRAVRQWIAQGCREPRRVPAKHPFSDTDWAAFVASRIALVHAVSKGRNPRLSGGMIANELKRIHRRAGL